MEHEDAYCHAFRATTSERALTVRVEAGNFLFTGYLNEEADHSQLFGY